MNKNYYKATLRCMREFVAATDKNMERFNRERAETSELYESARGSMLFDKALAEVDANFQSRRISVVEKTKNDLIKNLSGMRDEISSRAVKAPTTDMINSLTILSELEDVSLAQFKRYAASMADCPAAVQRLCQIAKEHGFQMSFLSPDVLLGSIDRLEGYLAEFLQYYTGDLSVCPSFIVRDMWRYFQPEDTYTSGVKFDTSTLAKTFHSTEEVDRLFWDKFVGFGTPDLMNSANDNAPVVQYFFSNVEALSDFINKSQNGLSDEKAKEVTASILSDCPEQYRAAYENFRDNGVVTDLNNFDTNN